MTEKLLTGTLCLNTTNQPTKASWQNQPNGMCTQRRLRSAWTSSQSDQSLLSTWRRLGSLATHWVHSEDSDQTVRMPRLIWVFVGCTVILLVLSWGSSYTELEEASNRELDIWLHFITVYAHLEEQKPHNARGLFLVWCVKYWLWAAECTGWDKPQKIIAFELKLLGSISNYNEVMLRHFSERRSTVMILSFWTDRSGQTVQTQIRLLLEEQSDQGLHCLQFPLHLLDALLFGKAILFIF